MGPLEVALIISAVINMIGALKINKIKENNTSNNRLLNRIGIGMKLGALLIDKFPLFID